MLQCHATKPLYSRDVCRPSMHVLTHCCMVMQGLVFGVGTDKGVVKLFDVRSYAQGPFDAFAVS